MGRHTKLVSAAALAIGLSGAAWSQPAQHYRFDVQAQDLGYALRAVTREAGLQLFASADDLRGRKALELHADTTVDDALRQLLAGTGLHAEVTAKAVFIRERARGDDDAAGEVSQSSDIVVTGTQIHGSAPIGAPLTVIDRAAIERSGHATVAEYIQTLPQNFSGGQNEGSTANNPQTSDNFAYGSSINLRGLGTESSLVLFDGARPALGGSIGAFVDTSLIPSGAIDRIEILTDGASAIYGTDAVAGVVNIRFRDHFEGFETHFYEGVAGAALHQTQASQTFGKRWSDGHVILAYQYDHRGRLPGDSRRYWTENLTPWGGPDERGGYSTPGTIIAANGQTFAIPSGQDGVNLTPGQLITNQSNLSDQRKSIDILPMQTTHSVFAAVDQGLFSGVRLYGRALYAHRNYAATAQPISFTPYSVPTTNPFYVDPIGTGQPDTVDYDFAKELGHFAVRGHLDAVTGSAGLKGHRGDWSFDVGGSYGWQNSREDEYNSVSATRVQIALADTDPATALNLFGNGTGNNPATLAFIRSNYINFARSTVWSAAARADGPLFDLPAGAVKLAVGAEHRHEQFTSGYTYNSTSTDPGDYLLSQTPGTPGQRHIDALYGELSIPIVNAPGGSFPGKLDASLSGRIDWYSDVGRTANPKAGLSWAVVPGIKLRGSWGTSFRAPTFFENGGATSNLYFPLLAQDSHSPTGTTPAVVISGYAPTIRPEKATSWTAGFDLTPHAVPGLSLSATYFDINYRDRIANPIADLAQILNRPDVYGALIETPTPAQVAAIYASPQLDNYLGIPAGDIRYILHTETQNLSRQTVRGVDFTLGYVHDLLGGSAAADLSGTRLITLSERITASSPATSVLDTIYNPVRWRMRGHLGWSGGGGFSADAFVNYSSGYRNTLVLPTQPVATWTTVDGQIGYRFDKASPLKGARIALSVTNLLNTRPPYVEYSVDGATFGYDPNQASAIGRQISIDMTFQW